MRSFAGRDILSLKDFERNEFFHVFDVAAKLEPIAVQRRNSDLLKEKTLVTAFYQPSTRTRLAHEAAMLRLGGKVTGFADAKMTRAGDFYQESIKDTVKMLEFYGDVIVMRHFQQGAPHEAAKWASIPVINGGDGWGEHPTQILTDLYTVLKEKGRIDGLKWVAVGDMRMRTMHSLGYALTQFDCPITFVAPPADALFPGSPDMRMPESYKADFRQYSLNFREAEHIEQVIADADVILVEPVVQPDYTKSRDERKGELPTTPDNYKITRELLERKAKPDAILLHSLPRMDEIPTDVDITRWSRYWQEAFNGVVMRMALLALVLGAME
ncbi:MAG: aspartate carbamoyltransferase [Anaerolineales bacterium]|nr:aspartate carbamoyltransferase [Anaerolineales bacterium]MCX7609214.1 aspartate carbamoyltransferase [Anaerolineales bacterium]